MVTDDVTRHRWAAWLPHAATGPDATAVFEHDDAAALTEALERLDDDTRHVVVLTDVPAVLATRTSPLRRFLAAERTGHDDRDHRPRRCGAGVLPFGARGRYARPGPLEPSCRTGRWARTGSTSPGWRRKRPPRSHGASPGLSDPEDPAGAGIGADRRRPDRGAARRADAPPPRSPRPGGRAVTIPHRRRRSACQLDGVVEVDLVRDGPHATDRRDDGRRQERSAPHARRRHRGARRPGPRDVRARRLQGRRDVRRVCRPPPHGRARHRPRRRARRACTGQPRGRGASTRAVAPRVGRHRPRRTSGDRRCTAASTTRRRDRRVRRARRRPARLHPGRGRGRPAWPESRCAPRARDATAGGGGRRPHPGQHQPATGVAPARPGRRPRRGRRSMPAPRCRVACRAGP